MAFNGWLKMRVIICDIVFFLVNEIKAHVTDASTVQLGCRYRLLLLESQIILIFEFADDTIVGFCYQVIVPFVIGQELGAAQNCTGFVDFLVLVEGQEFTLDHKENRPVTCPFSDNAIARFELLCSDVGYDVAFVTLVEAC